MAVIVVNEDNLIATKFAEYNFFFFPPPAPGAGEGTSTGELPHPPRKKRARVDPTVESVCCFPTVSVMGGRVKVHSSSVLCF